MTLTEIQKKALKRYLTEKKGLSIFGELGIRYDGAVQAAVLRTQAPDMNGTMLPTKTGPYDIRIFEKNEVNTFLRLSEPYVRQIEQDAKRDKLRDELASNPEKVLMKFAPRLYAISPTAVERQGKYFAIKTTEGKVVNVVAETAMKDIDAYLPKQEKIAALEVLSRLSGIIDVSFEPLFLATVGLDQVRDAETFLKTVIRDYTNGLENPDDIAYLRGRFLVSHGNVDFQVNPVVTDGQAVSVTDKDRIDKRNLLGWRTYSNLTKNLLRE